MNKGIVCSRVPGWWRAALSLLLVAFSSLAAGAGGPFPFEDVNDNGVWNPGIDRDISAELTPGEWTVSYTTPHSIVIPAGVTWLRSVEKFTGFYLVAGKNITVNASINSAVYAGMVDLQALGGTVAIGPKVALTGRDYVSVYAGKGIAAGAGASFVSRGGSANLGTVNLRAQTGAITLGGTVKFSTLRDVFITALAGDIAVDAGLRLDAPQGLLFVNGRQIALNGAQFRAADMTVTGGGVPLAFTNSRVTVPRYGSVDISNPGSSVDLRGTVLPRIGAITINAVTIIE